MTCCRTATHIRTASGGNAVIISSTPMAVPLRVKPLSPFRASRDRSSTPASKSDLANRASMATGLSCSAAAR